MTDDTSHANFNRSNRAELTLNSDQRRRALLGRGFLPKELPPPFNSNVLAERSEELRKNWDTILRGKSSKERDKYPLPSNPVLFDMARKGHARRTLAIPNAVNQTFLIEEVIKNFNLIDKTINGSRLSITKCEFAPEGRAIPTPSLSNLAEKRVILSAPRKSILLTDVASFYHSIYTHSIPWALHGKSAAKANRNKNDASLFGNRIDFLVRSCQDGQTIGIPVGPDTSRIISEFILCAVELRIPNNLHNTVADGYRYIDDFFLCFDSSIDADMFLAGLRDACLYFDLHLNSTKTKIVSAASFDEEIWPSEISAMHIAPPGKNQRRSLMHFFSRVIRLAKELPDESIASFSVRKTTRIQIQRDSWDLYEAFLLRMARENGNCIDSVVRIICTYAAIGYPISGSVRLFVEGVIADHAPLNHHYEVAWVLWLARSLNIRLSRVASSLVFEIENDVCTILAFHLSSRKLLTRGGQALSWLGTVNPDDLRGKHWLLIYEAANKGWPVRGAASAVAKDPFFAEMQNQKISFYDTRIYNKPLNLPQIEFEIDKALGKRKHALLPGAIMAYRKKSYTINQYDELGGDYGDDDDYFRYSILDQDDDEIDG